MSSKPESFISNSSSRRTHVFEKNQFNKPKVGNVLQRLLSNQTKASELNNNRLGSVYIKCLKRNVFCTLVDVLTNSVKTSCSLRVAPYENEYNERENPYERGLALGKLMGEKTKLLGYDKIVVYLVGSNKSSYSVIRGFRLARINVHSVTLCSNVPHNGCRPAIPPRKKNRTRSKTIR